VTLSSQADITGVLPGLRNKSEVHLTIKSVTKDEQVYIVYDFATDSVLRAHRMLGLSSTHGLGYLTQIVTKADQNELILVQAAKDDAESRALYRVKLGYEDILEDDEEAECARNWELLLESFHIAFEQQAPIDF